MLLTSCSLISNFEEVSHENANEEIEDPQRHIHNKIQTLSDSALRRKLEKCGISRPASSPLAIGHRGAPLKYAEHTRESYIAAAAQGAGTLECDVSFTNDGELVCRHAQCDLHTTTNIIDTPLNQKCTVPWNEQFPNPGAVKCCTSDISLTEFKSLTGKMDHHNPEAQNRQSYMDGSTDWRKDIIKATGTLLSHKESIELFDQLEVQFMPELKAPDRHARVQVEDVFGSTQAYAQKFIDDYKAAGIRSTRVWPQSFEPESVLYWLTAEPEFGRQAVMLDGRSLKQLNPQAPTSFSPSMEEIRAMGIKTIASPLWMLINVNDQGELEASAYAQFAKAADLNIVAWTVERSDMSQGSKNSSGHLNWYYQFDHHPNHQAIKTEGDVFKVIDVLAKEVGVLGIFSDWPETVSYYANCLVASG
ncbi:MAG: glycerophosphodiester phosphodiesterase family protein [Cellvibrionaceae bacterium]